MYEQAKDLKNFHEGLKQNAQALLKRVVETNNLGYALQVFQEVEDLLPTTSWIPDRDKYPLFRAYIDRDDTWRREGVYGFLDRFEEEVWYHTESTEEERAEIAKRDTWDPNKYVPLIWEVLKNGHSKFTLDW